MASVSSVDLWDAPFAERPVHAVVQLPGSKSATNRALVLAALAPAGQASLLRAPLDARDTTLMVDALRSLGARIDVRESEREPTTAKGGGDLSATEKEHAAWRVTAQLFMGSTTIDCGLAGTVMRFLPAAAALVQGNVLFDGDTHARKRPIAPMLEALRHLGAQIEGDSLPFTVKGTGALRGGEVTLDASASSQFVSGLLLAAPCFREGVTVRHVGPVLPSMPHIEMTVAMLRAAGARVDVGPDTWKVHHGQLKAIDWDIEPDLSNAAPFLGAAVATRGEVMIPGWPGVTTQAGDALRNLLSQMGAEVHLTSEGLRVKGSEKIRGIDVNLHDVGELTPVMAALCVLADNPSTLSGIAHLRGHETDRLAALTHELSAMGADVQETPDGLAIIPGPLHATTFETYDDHRMAQAGALLGLVVHGVKVQNIATTAKTMPNFGNLWEEMLRV